MFAADGAWHIARLSGVLERASAQSTMIVGVHGLPDDDGRLHEYVPGFDAERFAAHEKFFVHDVGRWVESRFGVALPADRTAVWGASLGGELALALGLRHPDVYGAVFSRRPAPATSRRRYCRVRFPASTSSRAGKSSSSSPTRTRWADALRNADADVALMQRDGEHGGAFWGEEFPLMVAWAFGH